MELPRETPKCIWGFGEKQCSELLCMLADIAQPDVIFAEVGSVICATLDTDIGLMTGCN